MSDLLQLVFAGVSQGAVYALLAIGLVSIFAVSGVINLAQGEFAAIGGLVAIAAVGVGLPLVLSVVVAVAVAVVVAVTVERFAITPVKRMTSLVSIILTLGVSTALKAVLLLLNGPDAEGLRPLTAGGAVVAGVSIRYQDLWVIAVTAVVAVGVHRFYDATLTGKALRACAEQPTAARLVGISLGGASLISFAIAGAVGGLAGVLASPLYFTSWESGLVLGLKGFVAATLGGLVSIRGAVLGGLLLGVLESLVAGYLDTGWRDAVAFLLLVVVLVIRPAGLFHRSGAVRV